MGSCLSSDTPRSKKYAAPDRHGTRPSGGGAGRQTPQSGQANGRTSSSAAAAAAAATAAKNRVPDFGLDPIYRVIKLLGKGGEGETWLCRENATGKEFACKLIKRPIPKPAIQVIKREIKIQADLGQGHLNIVGADEVVLTKTYLGLVMEYIPGGNMVNFVTKRRETKAERNGLCLDEDEARYYFHQLISAVEYCHRNHVAHRDLKLDNTLLTHHNPPRLKLCDFGFAKHWNQTSNMETMRIGTPEYMGPELISSRTGYDGKKVDVWASGVLLYVMLMGQFPFETNDDNFNNTAGLYDIWMQQVKTSWQEQPNNSGTGSRLSPELRALLDKMFDVKQDTRYTLDQIRAHAWFNKPLLPKYDKSLAELKAEQAVIDAALAQVGAQNAERDRSLEAMLDKASTAALPSEEITRVGLSKIRALLNPPDAAQPPMSVVKEES